MAEAMASSEMLTLADAQREYGFKRATLYRYARQGRLKIYRRGMDRHAYVRRAEMEALRSFQPAAPRRGLTMEAVERAREFQKRVFGDRVLTPSSAEIIEAARRERDEALP
jgi:hypothetical protein